MSVDLRSGRCGIIRFGNGRTFYCMSIEKYGLGDLYSVRIESGHYRSFKRNGVLARMSDRDSRRDIVEFIPCDYTDPRAKGLPTEITP